MIKTLKLTNDWSLQITTGLGKIKGSKVKSLSEIFDSEGNWIITLYKKITVKEAELIKQGYEKGFANGEKKIIKEFRKLLRIVR